MVEVTSYENTHFGIVVLRNDQGFAKQQSGRSHLEKEKKGSETVQTDWWWKQAEHFPTPCVNAFRGIIV